MTTADALLTTADKEEALSRAYAYAVAARAGYTTAWRNFDRDGVDLQINAGGAMRPALDIQLKATINLGSPRDGYFRFPLKTNNYELLRIDTQTHRILVVLDLPRDQSRWLTITLDELVLRRNAYWMSLKDHEESANQTSVTVYIPENQLFDADALRRLMERSRNRNVQ